MLLDFSTIWVGSHPFISYILNEQKRMRKRSLLVQVSMDTNKHVQIDYDPCICSGHGPLE